MSHNDGDGGGANNNMKELKFNLTSVAQVCKVLVHTNTRLTINSIIFIMLDGNGQRQPFLSPISGNVTKVFIHEWDILSHGSIVLEYEECRHTITFKNLCADCGIDLNQLKNVLSASNSAKLGISMGPSFLGTTVTAEEALEYDNEDRNQLLYKRKLYLLVDLNQTLVHTTHSKNHYPYAADVVACQLSTSIIQTSYTILRPGAKEFLANLHPFYQFRLVTSGDRAYVDTIAKVIDPDGTFFSHGVLSHDECLNLTDKTTKLRSLFSCSDSLVCIIDDRDDIWNYAPNLVHVKPHKRFTEMHFHSPTDTVEGKHQPNRIREGDGVNDQMHRIYKVRNTWQIPTIRHSNVVGDADLYLHRLEIILKHVHTQFYTAYDQWLQGRQRAMPDLKQIIPHIRGQVLKSVSLCFSHVMPQDYPIEKHRATMMAQALGAKVTSDLQFEQNSTTRTTHIIAGKGTLKVYLALQNDIKGVTPEWLIDCYERWEKQPEENYILTRHYRVKNSRLFMKDTSRALKRRYSDIRQPIPIEPLLFEPQYSQINDDNLVNKIPPEDLLVNTTSI